MPIKRKLAKNFDTWDRILHMAKDAVRSIQYPLSDIGWRNLISKELEIDLDTTSKIFEELVMLGVLSFTRRQGKKAIYVNDRTPAYKRYMWVGDLQYE